MAEREEKQSRQVTRDQLYRQVWEVPMSRLAAEYGISGNGLAKICDRLNVPYPPRGWWAKKAAGKKVVTYRLPPLGEGVPQVVMIHPTPSRPARPPVAKGMAVAIPERLVRPHRIIAGWLEDHARRRREARGERDPLVRRLRDPGDFAPADRRRHCILDALFRELERLGGKVEEDQRGNLVVKLGGAQVEFRIREKMKQVRRPYADHDPLWMRTPGRDWKRELEGTGRFVVAIKTFLGGGLKTEWVETDSEPMSELLPEIAATIVAAGPVLRDMRRAREEAERLRRIEEARRAEEEARRRQEKNRWKRLTEHAQAWRSAQVAREFLATLKDLSHTEQHDVVDGRTVAEWISWAEAHLREADPMTHGAKALFHNISEVKSWTYRD